MEYSKIDIIDIEVKLTEHIQRLSKSNKLIWSRNELGHYLASYEGLSVKIEFFNFVRMDEQSSDDSCGTVSINISKDDKIERLGLGFDFSVGTKQFSNLKKAIAYNFKDWKDSLELGGRKYIEVLNYLSEV